MVLMTWSRRLLLPLMDDDDIETLVACLYLGLRLRFEGDPAHLIVTPQIVPDAASGLQKQYLVLMDAVPGGTGYLKTLYQEKDALGREGEGIMDLLRRTRDTLETCRYRVLKEHHDQEDTDGCYRCVRTYHLQYSAECISRERGLRLLNQIIAAGEKREQKDALATIKPDALFGSLLEKKFVEALRAYIEQQQGTWESTIIKGRRGFRFAMPGAGRLWELELQPVLGVAHGVMVSSQPDFLLQRDDDYVKPMAIFTDGFEYHCAPTNRLADDIRKRRAILESGNYWMWSVTWDDVTTDESDTPLVCHPTLAQFLQQFASLAQAHGQTLSDAHLAKRLEDPKSRIFVTTFTTTLSIDIKQRLRRLGPDVADRIEVTNLRALSRTICARSGWRRRIATDEETEEIWEDVWRDRSLESLPMSREALEEEYRWVVDPNGITDEEAYLTTIRSGRPRWSREQRRQVWVAFRAFQRGLNQRNLLTFEGAIHQARLAVEHGGFPRYQHVLVDEVQDFSLEALRLIRVLSPLNGMRDPLCLVGDGHQRIHRLKIPLSRAGIDVRGRSRRLKINHRTSKQIHTYAQGILQGLDIDDLEGGTISIAGDHSVFKGPEPLVKQCQGAKSEADAVVSWVQMLREKRGVATYAMCVTPYKPAIREALHGCWNLDIRAQGSRGRSGRAGAGRADREYEANQRPGVSCRGHGLRGPTGSYA